MRNVDISRMPSEAIREIWGSLGVDQQRVACASSIGAFLAEFIVCQSYAAQFTHLLSSITQPKSPGLPESTLVISVDDQYSPLAPYSHIIPPTCKIPGQAIDALEKYARQSLRRRWSNLYHSATHPGVREFIRTSLEQYSLDVLPAPSPSTPSKPAKTPASPLRSPGPSSAAVAHTGSDLVHHRPPNHSILSVDHLAELIPKPDVRRLIVYADGAYLPDRGTAGIGAYFENIDVPPIAERLRGHQSNARAEIYAMVLALDRLSAVLQEKEDEEEPTPDGGGAREIWVCSDSRYVVDGVNIYLETWEQTDWLTAKGRPVANRTAFRHLHKCIRDLSGRGYTLFIHHLPSHAGIRGNEIADMLAKAGALL
ncbi:ribonuclease H-like protein [Martensiomyces pterosporus]|nr:ribonuclease H-like protein [Martensiomyces pterosporus]